MKIKEIITVQRATGETNCIHYEQPNGKILIDVCITSDIEDESVTNCNQLKELFNEFNTIFSNDNRPKD